MSNLESDRSRKQRANDAHLSWVRVVSVCLFSLVQVLAIDDYRHLASCLFFNLIFLFVVSSVDLWSKKYRKEDEKK